MLYSHVSESSILLSIDVSVLDLVPSPSSFGDLRQVTRPLCISLFPSVNWGCVVPNLYIFYKILNRAKGENVCNVAIKSIRIYIIHISYIYIYI